MALTDTECRKAKATDSLRKLSDGNGLQLWIMPKGGKLWRVAYRFDGKQKLLSIGAYPAISLAQARERCSEARKMLATGADPSLQIRLAKLAKKVAGANTFSAVASEYVEKQKREMKAPATVTKTEWLLSFATPDLGLRPIADISAVEVLAVLRKIDARGTHETATRLRSLIGAIFRYAIATARAENDPTFALRGALTTPTVTPRAAILNSNSFGALLRAIDSFDGQPATHAALKLMAYLFPRPGELRLAEWHEFDLEKAEWSIPAHRMKMRRAHRVPFPPQAVTILKELQRLTGSGKFAFPSVRTFARSISENTLNAALRRLGYTKEQATAHGFRATASTLLNESGKWRPDVIEAALAHVGADEIRRAYLRSDFWEERKQMMHWWADHINKLQYSNPVR